MPVWHSRPSRRRQPVHGLRERAHPPRLLFVGRSTEHRERILAPVKASSRWSSRPRAVRGSAAGFLRRADVQLNLHNNPYPTFENRVSIALAAGHLVISEPLSPSHGLTAGRDYLEITPRMSSMRSFTDRWSRARAVRGCPALRPQEAERFVPQLSTRRWWRGAGRRGRAGASRRGALSRARAEAAERRARPRAGRAPGARTHVRRGTARPSAARAPGCGGASLGSDRGARRSQTRPSAESTWRIVDVALEAVGGGEITR